MISSDSSLRMGNNKVSIDARDELSLSSAKLTKVESGLGGSLEINSQNIDIGGFLRIRPDGVTMGDFKVFGVQDTTLLSELIKREAKVQADASLTAANAALVANKNKVEQVVEAGKLKIKLKVERLTNELKITHATLTGSKV